MFPDLRNNLKSSGLSLYECSISYNTLKCSFAARILITTSGGVFKYSNAGPLVNDIVLKIIGAVNLTISLQKQNFLLLFRPKQMTYTKRYLPDNINDHFKCLFTVSKFTDDTVQTLTVHILWNMAGRVRHKAVRG